MISMDQVQLLEARVSKAIEYVKRVSAENAALLDEREGLRKKLDANQKRIDELEVHVTRFKEEQGRIEDGIIAALDRLSQFEEAFENSLKDKVSAKKPAAKTRGKAPATDGIPVSNEIFFEIPPEETARNRELVKENISSEGELDIF